MHDYCKYMSQRSFSFLISLGSLAALGLAATTACSASKAGAGNNGSGAGNGDGSIAGDGSGDGLGLGVDGGGVPNGNIDQTTGSTQGCDENTPCPANEACVAKETSGCADSTGSTAVGVCRAVIKECTADTDCGGDTICCVGDCAIDGAAGSCVRPCGTDESCKDDDPAVGVFSPSTQCEWKGPAADDPYPGYTRVLSSPLVANLPNDSGASAEIIIVTTGETAGAATSNEAFDASNPGGELAAGGVIRILNGQTCEQLEVIETDFRLRSPATPALADLDGDGNIDIVARGNGYGAPNPVLAFSWDGSRFVDMWQSENASKNSAGFNNDWDGVSIHDLNNDGKPEVIGRNGAVYNGQTGATLYEPDADIVGLSDPTIGDVDRDGRADLIANKIWSWDNGTWVESHPGANKTPTEAPRFYAYADFGTPADSGFQYGVLDGIAEIVTSGVTGNADANVGNDGHVALYTLDGDELMYVKLDELPTTLPRGEGGERGGAPTISDFSGDGKLQIALAHSTAFTVFDPSCTTCGANHVSWSQPAQDNTSAQTGSSIFDFDSDGKSEAVYADECFTRIYDGQNGDVLFSAVRRSCTWWESPTIADPDGDTRTEIIVNSNDNCSPSCGVAEGTNNPITTPGDGQVGVDPIHPGARCEDDSECISKSCIEGLCRCETDLDCGNDFVPAPNTSENRKGLICTAPIAGTPGEGKVCRAAHANSANVKQKAELNGLRVYRDALDRWADSRPMWNQHAYSVTNINDDGSVPSTSEWQQNFVTDGLNNYRQNRASPGGANLLPDITSILSRDNICQGNGDSITLTGSVCNRGLRVVGADMPATFYIGPPEDGNILCVSYTQGPVQLGDECLPVSCEITEDLPANAEIYLKVNDDGKGNRTTEECDETNNVDLIAVPECTLLR